MQDQALGEGKSVGSLVRAQKQSYLTCCYVVIVTLFLTRSLKNCPKS